MTAPYVYNAAVVDAYDGDTATLRIDLGFAISMKASIRLLGINAIELHSPGGQEARTHLLALMPVGSAVTITSVAWDKYGGRVDGAITANGVDVSAQMVKDGYAAAWTGKGPKPVPPWPIPTGGS